MLDKLQEGNKIPPPPSKHTEGVGGGGVQTRIPKQEMVGDGTAECMVITSGSLQYSLNNEGLLMQSSPTPVLSLPLSSSKRILAYQKPVNDRIFEVN